MTKAVIDVGSNSVLLLIAEKTERGWKTIHETSAVTGLGSNTKVSGLIGEPGATKTLEALKFCFEQATKHNVAGITAAGTMALRIATNARDFLSRAKAQGTPLTILSGDDEARLGFLAVAEDPIFSRTNRLTIVDPGGHSTELMTAEKQDASWNTLYKRSFPIGALGLIETNFPKESPSFAERLAAVDSIDSTINLEYLPHQCGTVVVLGATGTNLISIREKLTEWKPDLVHGQTLDFEEISRAVGWMCDMTEAQRAAILGIEKGRERTIHIGALILERFLQATHALECKVSVRGWRHALLDHPITTPV
jgi:exopolyphosphatase / guanosine-5'-triphosphate,3'-diphosphate pyrophosphatase